MEYVAVLNDYLKICSVSKKESLIIFKIKKETP